MDDIEVLVRIKATPERVWALIGNPARMGEWSPECQRVDWLDGATKAGPGARFKGHNRLGWRRWSTTGTIVSFSPGHEIGWDVAIAGLPVANWTYRIGANEANGGCTLTEIFHDRRGGLVEALGRVGRGVADTAAHNRAGMEKTLDRIKADAEGSPGAA